MTRTSRTSKTSAGLPRSDSLALPSRWRPWLAAGPWQAGWASKKGGGDSAGHPLQLENHTPPKSRPLLKSGDAGTESPSILVSRRLPQYSDRGQMAHGFPIGDRWLAAVIYAMGPETSSGCAPSAFESRFHRVPQRLSAPGPSATGSRVQRSNKRPSRPVAATVLSGVRLESRLPGSLSR